MPDWDGELGAIRIAVGPDAQPSVEAIREERNSPWDVLVSTIISLRTKDAVTIAASRRLLECAPDAATLADMPEERIAELIYPAGFYRSKAANLRSIAAILVARYGGRVPDERDALMALPGVGLKTANLVLGAGFGIPAICVDIHVHRIANRRGWVATGSPDDTEEALREVLPKAWWIDINRLLVLFGQRICTPLSPRCSACPVADSCPKTGVETQR